MTATQRWVVSIGLLLIVLGFFKIGALGVAMVFVWSAMLFVWILYTLVVWPRKCISVNLRYLICGAKIVYFRNISRVVLRKDDGEMILYRHDPKNGDVRLFSLHREKFPTAARKDFKIKKNKADKFNKVSHKIIGKVMMFSPGVELVGVEDLVNTGASAPAKRPKRPSFEILPLTARDPEFQKASALSKEYRYLHFIEKAVVRQAVWALEGKLGFLDIGDEKSGAVFPVFPHPQHAEAYAGTLFPEYTPTPILIKNFVHEWLPHLQSEGITVCVFPTPRVDGVRMEAQRLQRVALAGIARHDASPGAASSQTGKAANPIATK